jgi:hypothetical protein
MAMRFSDYIDLEVLRNIFEYYLIQGIGMKDKLMARVLVEFALDNGNSVQYGIKVSDLMKFAKKKRLVNQDMKLSEFRGEINIEALFAKAFIDKDSGKYIHRYFFDVILIRGASWRVKENAKGELQKQMLVKLNYAIFPRTDALSQLLSTLPG